MEKHKKTAKTSKTAKQNQKKEQKRKKEKEQKQKKKEKKKKHADDLFARARLEPTRVRWKVSDAGSQVHKIYRLRKQV